MTGTGAGTVTDKSERPSHWRRPRHRHVLATPLSLRKYCHKQRARTTTDSQPARYKRNYIYCRAGANGRKQSTNRQVASGKRQVASGGMQQKIVSRDCEQEWEWEWEWERSDTAWRNQIKCRKHGIEGRAKSSQVEPCHGRHQVSLGDSCLPTFSCLPAPVPLFTLPFTNVHECFRSR